jgi:predicted nucleic acid-binding protein
VDPDDQFHQKARTELERLQEERLLLSVSWSTITESYTLILGRLGIRKAQTWLEELTEGAGLINPRREDYLEAARWLRRYPDQDISLCDGVLAILAEQLRFPVWTYDHHFDVMRIPVWR